MKIDFGQPITDLDNRPIVDTDGPMTLAAAAVFVLMRCGGDYRTQEKGIELAIKIKTANTSPLDLTLEEVAALQSQIKQSQLAALVKVRAVRLLEAAGNGGQ